MHMYLFQHKSRDPRACLIAQVYTLIAVEYEHKKSWEGGLFKDQHCADKDA